MEINQLSETLTNLASGETNRRQKVLFEANYPGISDAIEHGMNVQLVSADHYFNEIGNRLRSGEKGAIAHENSTTAVACQIGEDRSTEVKLFAIDAEIPFALSEKDKEKLKFRSHTNPYTKIGMSLENLGNRIADGEIRNNDIYPEGFSQPIKRIVGFVDSKSDQIDLSDVEIMTRWINTARQRSGLEKLDLSVTIVHGHGQIVKNAIDNIRKEQNIKSVSQTR